MNSVIAASWFRWICGLFIGVCVLVRTVEGVFFNWNAIRLSRALAFVQGYDLYTPPDSGVISGVIYGPIGYLFYAPAALWKSPVPALITGCFISVLVTLGPAALLLSDRRNSGGARPWTPAVFTVLVLHFYASGATSGVWMVHTDAGALGLTCLALYFTLRHPLEKRFSWNVAAAALSAALAVWAKQTTAPILVLPCVYLMLRGCRGGALRILALTGLLAGLLGAIFAAIYGLNDVRLSVLDVPSRHARYIGVMLQDWRLITDFMEILYMLAVVIVGSVAIKKSSTQGAAPGRVPFLARWNAFVPDWTAWPLVFATGLALFPMSLLGRIKSGGTANNYGITDYFLAVGIALLFLRLAGRNEFRQGAGRRALEASLVLLLMVMGVRTTANLLVTSREIARKWPPSIQAAYDFSRKHPGTTYFPWHPLAHLQGESRFFHTGWGVMERESAGFLVSDAHFRDGLPKNLQRVATTRDVSLFGSSRPREWDDYLLQKFPEFRCRVTEPALPGWTVFVKGPANCRPQEQVESATGFVSGR